MRAPANARIFRYVPIPDVERALSVGWLATDGLYGTHHGVWSVLCCWLCDCEPRGFREAA